MNKKIEKDILEVRIDSEVKEICDNTWMLIEDAMNSIEFDLNMEDYPFGEDEDIMRKSNMSRRGGAM